VRAPVAAAPQRALLRPRAAAAGAAAAVAAAEDKWIARNVAPVADAEAPAG
jgi:hypothetical protein